MVPISYLNSPIFFRLHSYSLRDNPRSTSSVALHKPLRHGHIFYLLFWHRMPCSCWARVYQSTNWALFRNGRSICPRGNKRQIVESASTTSFRVNLLRKKYIHVGRGPNILDIMRIIKHSQKKSEKKTLRINSVDIF